MLCLRLFVVLVVALVLSCLFCLIFVSMSFVVCFGLFADGVV